MIARVDARGSSVAPTGAFARIAYEFVRGQVESVAALARVLRGRHRLTDIREEERW